MFADYEFIKTEQEIIKRYNDFRDSVIEVLTVYISLTADDFYFEHLDDDLYVDDDGTVHVNYTAYIYGEFLSQSFDFPLVWCYCSLEELKDEIKKYKDECARKMQAIREQLQAQADKEREEKERAEYERLKAKFEVNN